MHFKPTPQRSSLSLLLTQAQRSGYFLQKLSDLMMQRCLLGQNVQALLNQPVTPCEPS